MRRGRAYTSRIVSGSCLPHQLSAYKHPPTTSSEQHARCLSVCVPTSHRQRRKVSAAALHKHKQTHSKNEDRIIDPINKSFDVVNVAVFVMARVKITRTGDETLCAALITHQKETPPIPAVAAAAVSTTPR